MKIDLEDGSILVGGVHYVRAKPEPKPDLADEYVERCLANERLDNFTPDKVKWLIRNAMREAVRRGREYASKQPKCAEMYAGEERAFNSILYQVHDEMDRF